MTNAVYGKSAVKLYTQLMSVHHELSFNVMICK